ncbi:uncharacterized protein LACBIDRAFT_304122 [Laccaria bicolor S238N-H82]|uniref:Predicted protein n=1 Tax=Laccaria bicolor (strain S238N-H82 / ATCC MYA-4686) TaxID=486041 RepID=B0DL00_LACBS|nr:uncharacterized protein LACBIDRAFT_304122 [Laccaria bicolor S238N-H82]EDR04827.1 predicted protein [Laccaria bicolor S238N-H82]|eukprot:XP_001884651.1 predicted protein [Laccaria bicolor S238N-H82]
MAMNGGSVSVWDIRSKVPFRTFTETPWPRDSYWPQRYPQFSSGNFGKETLVFVEVISILSTSMTPILQSFM